MSTPSARQLAFTAPSPAAVDAARLAAAPIPMLGGVSLAWIEQIAEIARNYGHALRPGDGPWIEVQSINTGGWSTLTLDSRAAGDCAFASIEDRDAVLAEIVRRVSRLDPFRTCKTNTLHLATVEAMEIERRERS